MADAATPSLDCTQACQVHAARVLAVTACAWQLAPPSPQALARRAAHGYVPRRARLRAAAAAIALRAPAAGLAYSW